MTIRIVLALAATLLFVGAAVRADEEITVRGKDKAIKSRITAESPKGIALSKDFIPAADVLDVVYLDLKPAEVRITIYRPAVKAERDANEASTEAKQKALLADALKKYEETFAKVDTSDTLSNGKSAKRHLAYKIALLKMRQAQEEGAPLAPALAKLKEFRAKYKGGWQTAPALELLARLQAGQKQYDQAVATLTDLAKLDVPATVKHDAELSAVQVLIQAGRQKEAGAQLDDLAKSATKDPRFAARVKAVQAELLVAANQTEKAKALLRQIIKGSSDRRVKAIAHNALGMALFKEGNFKDARWEFLWVDVYYNQDPDEHAKALYHLWKVFENLGDAVRAQECRETLLSDRQYNGLDYQRRAQVEAKAP